MHLPPNLIRLWLFTLVCFSPLLANAQTLALSNEVQTLATLSNTTATLTGKAELHVTGTGDPITGCVINLNSPDAWFFLENIVPSTVASTFLSRIRVNGAAAVNDTNVRIVQYELGTVVIPHAPDFSPMEAFDGKSFTGPSKSLRSYLKYNDTSLGVLKMSISSFRLKRGYMATVAQNENGTGVSKCYVAQDGDLEVGALPATLDNNIRFVRIFPWRWVSKKGFAGTIWQNLKPLWFYNWNLDQNSSLNVEYVPIRQVRYWPGLDENWKTRGASHLLGYNEPDQAGQANMSVADAIYSWPDLLATGLRVGAPAVSDGGLSWLYSFIDQADAAGLRVDFVPVHYYRSYPNAADPAGAASQFYNFLKGVHDRVKRPLWVTEYNNGANWTSGPDPTAAQQAATIAAFNDMLDSTPWVERYSVFNWVEDVRRVVWDDGSTTAAGVVYRDNASPNAYRQELPDAGTAAAAHYSFNGDARDASGNGHDATTVGTPVFTTGKYGQAISLDGATDYLQLSPRLGDSTDFSFTGWVYWNGGGNWQRIFDLGESTDRYLCLIPKSGSNTLRFVIKNGAEQIIDTTVLPAGVWTHVAVTLSGDTGKLFVNGALVKTNTAMTFNPADLGTSANYLGKSQFADPLFNGRLDDLRFFSTALTDAQVAAIAANAPPQFTTNPIAANATKLAPFTGSISGNATGGNGARTFSKLSGPAWLAVAANGSLTGVPTLADTGLNTFLVRVTDSLGAQGTTSLQVSVAEPPGLVARYAFDSSTNASVGAAHGAATGSPLYAAGRTGAAIDLDGTDDFVTLPKDVATYPELTIGVWINWDGGSSAWQRVFDFGNGTGEYMFLSPKGATNNVRFGIVNNGAEQSLNTTTLPVVGQWTHLAVTLGANVGRLYVNGVLKDTQTITLKPTDFSPATNFIGKSQWPDPLFNGRIDDFVIFNQVLSPAQVAALAGGRAPAFAAGIMSRPAAVPAQIYEQTLAGSATDPDFGTTLTFTKASGPAWLSVSPNGRISGVPAASDAGVNRFIVRVTDPTLLSADAVLNIAVAGAGGLLANYQFDGSLLDAAGGAAGVATGSPVYDAGIFDRAIRFDGVDDYVKLPAGLINSTADITFAARVFWNGGANWQRIFDFGTGLTQYAVLTPKSGGGTLRFTIKNTGAEQIIESSPLPVGEWTHVAVTLIGNTGTLYVNGAAVATQPVTIDPSAFAPTLNYLGKSQFTADPPFSGLVDEFRLYNRGLSASEISALAVPAAAVNVPDSSYTGWAAAIAFPAGQSAGSADPDNDGISNVWEYILDSDPLSPASGALPKPTAMSAAALGLGDTGKTYITIQARIRKQRFGTTLVAEAAASLAQLATASAVNHAVPAGPPVADGGFEIFTYYYDIPIQDSAEGTGFIRLRAGIE